MYSTKKDKKTMLFALKESLLSTTVGAISGGTYALADVTSNSGVADWSIIAQSGAVGIVACFTIYLIIKCLLPFIVKLLDKRHEEDLKLRESATKHMTESAVNNIREMVETHILAIKQENLNTVKEHAKLFEEINNRLDNIEHTTISIKKLSEVSNKLVILLTSQLMDQHPAELIAMLNDTLNIDGEN